LAAAMTRDDPWQQLAAIREQAALVRANATELEQLGLTLSGRDLSVVDHADLVSYVIWISQFTSQTALVLANWGSGLVAYMESSLRAAGMTPPTPPPDVPTLPDYVAPPEERPRRRWRRS
jgi:hypothetical protein